MNLTPVRLILIVAFAVLVAGLIFLGGMMIFQKPDKGTLEPIARMPEASGPGFSAEPPPTEPAATGPTPVPAPVPTATEPAVSYSGDGFSVIEAEIDNRTGEPAAISWKPGSSFEASLNRMIVTDRRTSEVPSMMRSTVVLRAYPLTAAGRPGRHEYRPGEAIDGDLRLLAEAIADDPTITADVARSAVLMLSDNPPLDVFAMFPRPQRVLSPDLDLESYRVSTLALVEALVLMKEMRLPWQNLQVATDPQFPIEALYSVESHDRAAAFYGITREREWVFWKRLLLHGPPSLRHYALFGIARYFPDVALLMHPKWVEAVHLPYIFRVTAVRSLAITDRSEAIPLLRRIRRDWSRDAEIVTSADNAIAYLLWKTYRAAPPSQRAAARDAGP